MSTALEAVRPQGVILSGGGRGLPMKDELDTITNLAAWIARAQTFPALNTTEKVFTALIYVRDMDIAMVPALGKCYFINGRFSIEIEAKLWSIEGKLPGFEWEIVEHTEDVCRVRGRIAKDQPWKEASFTMDRARKAKLAGKDTYQNYGMDMIKWRAIGRLLQIVGGRAYSTIRQTLPPIVFEDLDDDPAGSNAEVVEVEMGSALNPADAPPPTVTGVSPAADTTFADAKEAFIRRAQLMGYVGAQKIGQLVNVVFADMGLTRVKKFTEVAPMDWPKLFAYIDERYDENGQKRFAEGEQTPKAGAAVADPATETVTTSATGGAAAEPVDAPAIAMPSVAQPEQLDPEGLPPDVVAACEAGDGSALWAVGAWAQTKFPASGKWVQEHPEEGSNRIFVVQPESLLVANFVRVENGRRVAVPVLIVTAQNDDAAAQIPPAEQLAPLGKAMVGWAAELRRAAHGDAAARAMPAKAGAALAAARAAK